jgi:hypothetical protein
MDYASQRYLLNMKPARAYVLPDREAGEYLVANGYAAYVPKAKPFMTMTAKGVAYANRERMWIERGRTGA